MAQHETCDWTRSELDELVKVVKTVLPKDDTMSYGRRMRRIDWEKIEVGKRTGEECRTHMDNKFKKLRHVRSVAELFADSNIYQLVEKECKLVEKKRPIEPKYSPKQSVDQYSKTFKVFLSKLSKDELIEYALQYGLVSEEDL